MKVSATGQVCLESWKILSVLFPSLSSSPFTSWPNPSNSKQAGDSQSHDIKGHRLYIRELYKTNVEPEHPSFVGKGDQSLDRIESNAVEDAEIVGHRLYVRSLYKKPADSASESSNTGYSRAQGSVQQEEYKTPSFSSPQGNKSDDFYSGKSYYYESGSFESGNDNSKQPYGWDEGDSDLEDKKSPTMGHRRYIQSLYKSATAADQSAGARAKVKTLCYSCLQKRFSMIEAFGLVLTSLFPCHS